MKIRKNAKERKQEILNAAMKVAEEIGHKNIMFSTISKQLNISSPLISHYFRNLTSLKVAVLSMAIKTENVSIIAHALAARDPKVKKIKNDLKVRAIAFLMS